MDALQGRPKVGQIKSVEELRELTLADRTLLLEAYAEGHTPRVLGAWTWLRDHGNRWPMLNGATDFEPYRIPNQYNPQPQDYIFTANAILAWCDTRKTSNRTDAFRLLETVQYWKAVAADQIDDIGGWRNATDNPTVDSNQGLYWIVTKRGWDKPARFSTDTTRIVGTIVTEYPKLDPTPIQDIYSAVSLWHEERNARSIPPQSQLMVTLDRAMMVLQAVERDCELRLRSKSEANSNDLRMASAIETLEEVRIAVQSDISLLDSSEQFVSTPGVQSCWETAKLAALYLERLGLTDDAELLRAEAKKLFRAGTDLLLSNMATCATEESVAIMLKDTGSFPVPPSDEIEAGVFLIEQTRSFRKFAETVVRHVERVQGVLGKRENGMPVPSDTIPKRQTQKQKATRGRRVDTDLDNDRRITEAWASREHKRYIDLAKARGGGETTKDIAKAIDRHRKRLKRRKSA